MQMTFSLAWITEHGMRRYDREGSEEFSWVTEGKCDETDCLWQRLTDSFSFFLTVQA